MHSSGSTSSPPAHGPARRRARRAVWLRQLHQWHWISSAICLMAMLLFSITGFTLNHASQIEAKPAVTRQKAALPAPLRERLAAFAASHADAKLPLPDEVASWANAKLPGRRARRERRVERGRRLCRPAPPGRRRLAAHRRRRPGRVRKTDRGWISWLNDMHKGRNAGAVWSWFIDIFAGACLVFCITGFLILKYHAANRPSTWPVIGFGIVLPIVLALLFVH
jgi:hypothetical protein